MGTHNKKDQQNYSFVDIHEMKTSLMLDGFSEEYTTALINRIQKKKKLLSK